MSDEILAGPLDTPTLSEFLGWERRRDGSYAILHSPDIKLPRKPDPLANLAHTALTWEQFDRRGWALTITKGVVHDAYGHWHARAVMVRDGKKYDAEHVSTSMAEAWTNLMMKIAQWERRR